MIVVKKINNNVAICLDGNQKELIAFGNGIGFPEMPYELTDMERIDRTFYNVSSQYFSLVNEISPVIIDFTMKMIDHYQRYLKYTLSPNIVFTLADHLSFAIKRIEKGIYVKMPLSYEMEQMYPIEIKIAKKILDNFNREFNIHLPESEASGIAINFVNNSYMQTTNADGQRKTTIDLEGILEDITWIVEEEMEIVMERATFSYARFATHMRYLLGRLEKDGSLISENEKMYQEVSKQYQMVSTCVDKIAVYLQEKLHKNLTNEERLYLILHVNRICEKEGL